MYVLRVFLKIISVQCTHMSYDCHLSVCHLFAYAIRYVALTPKRVKIRSTNYYRMPSKSYIRYDANEFRLTKAPININQQNVSTESPIEQLFEKQNSNLTKKREDTENKLYFEDNARQITQKQIHSIEFSTLAISSALITT